MHKICMTILKKKYQKTVFKNCYGYIVTFLKAPGLMNEFIEAQAGAVLAGAAQAGAQRLQLNDLQRSAPSTDTTDSLAEPRFVNYFFFFLVLQFNFFFSVLLNFLQIFTSSTSSRMLCLTCFH